MFAQKRPFFFSSNDSDSVFEARVTYEDHREWIAQAQDLTLQSPVYTPAPSEFGTDCGTSEGGSLQEDIPMVRAVTISHILFHWMNLELVTG